MSVPEFSEFAALSTMDENMSNTVFGVRVVTVARRIAPHEHDILDAERRSAKQVRLNGDAIPVPGGDLQDRFDTAIDEQMGDRHWAHRHARGMRIGDVERIHRVLEQVGTGEQSAEIRPLGWGQFRCHNEPARLQSFAEAAHAFSPKFTYQFGQRCACRVVPE